VDLVPGVLCWAFLGHPTREAGGDSGQNASNQHMGRVATPQVGEPRVVIALFGCLVGP
jgi:hypothetical protein